MANWLRPAFAANEAPKPIDADLISSRKIGKAQTAARSARRRIAERVGGHSTHRRTGRALGAPLHGGADIYDGLEAVCLAPLRDGRTGGSKSDPKHQYYLCDIENGCALSPLTEETGCVAPSVSPDGKYLYYFVDETTVGGGKFALKRVNLDGTDRRTLLVVDGPLPDTKFRPSRLYPISTISSDSKRLAISGCLGDGECDPPPYGLMVFDLEKATVKLILHGPTWCNLHSQYCRSTDPEASHDILIQGEPRMRRHAEGRVEKIDRRRGGGHSRYPRRWQPTSATCRGAATVTSFARATNAGAAALPGALPAPVRATPAARFSSRAAPRRTPATSASRHPAASATISREI